MTEEKRQLAEEEHENPSGERTDKRVHHQGLGDQWVVLVGDPQAAMPQVVGTVLHAGGTRPCWQRKTSSSEFVLMAWPEDKPIRAAVLMQGALEGSDEERSMKPVTAMPLLEGAPNDFMVDDVIPWASGVEANVGVEVIEGSRPMWFYDPLYYRDKEDLTPGVTHTFLLAGLAFGLRKALLDDITITKGPRYEDYAAAWLAENPGKNRLDVPPLKMSMVGRKIIMPGRNFCEYEIRNSILSVEKTQLDKLEVYMLGMAFDFDDRPPMQVMLYVPVHVCGDYEPQEGDEVDAYIWLQGRIMDV